jgi:bifunctional pyridoxal-dependent enzyme with beta-cystathionase and maltose regulon repressor activities
LSESELESVAGGSDTDDMTVISDEIFAELIGGNPFAGGIEPAIPKRNNKP